MRVCPSSQLRATGLCVTAIPLALGRRRSAVVPPGHDACPSSLTHVVCPCVIIEGAIGVTEEDQRDTADAGHTARQAGTGSLDRDLLQGVQQRERGALGRFFDAVFPFVYNLAYRFTGDRSSAQDVAQEVFLKVYRAADRLDLDRSPYPWLTAITANTCRDLARRVATRAEEPVDELPSDGPPDSTPVPDEALVRKEEEIMLERALMSLDESHRAIVILHDYCGCSHEEIASIIDASHAAVRKRYSRALEMLRQTIRKWEK